MALDLVYFALEKKATVATLKRTVGWGRWGQSKMFRGWGQTFSFMLWWPELSLQFCERTVSLVWGGRIHLKGVKIIPWNVLSPALLLWFRKCQSHCRLPTGRLILIATSIWSFWGSRGDAQGTVSLSVIKHPPEGRTTCISIISATTSQNPPINRLKSYASTSLAPAVQIPVGRQSQNLTFL